jgi:predicted nucleic acid-binding protein
VILVDTSVWIDHFRRTDSALAVALDAANVLMHPFVLGEIAFGSLTQRDNVLALLGQLPHAPLATPDEVLAYIESHSLMGKGVGYVDVHLLASAALFGRARIWTRDKALQSVARGLGLAHPR